MGDGLAPYKCGCGRDWGCVEAYTTISGLPQMLADALKRHPGHPLATSTESEKDKALSLRDLAQDGDTLALEIFDLQARALGFHAANMIRYFYNNATMLNKYIRICSQVLN
jgi:predicted NBD/HSP70 family sugar kinase